MCKVRYNIYDIYYLCIILIETLRKNTVYVSHIKYIYIIFNDGSYQEAREDGFHLILGVTRSTITQKPVTPEGSPMAIHLPALQALGCPPRSNSKFMVSKYQSSPSLDKCIVVSQGCFFLWFQKDEVVMIILEDHILNILKQATHRSTGKR